MRWQTQLWFDVEIGYYTTLKRQNVCFGTLWFDVEIGYYTTRDRFKDPDKLLWFDVEIGYYTTLSIWSYAAMCCDLM